MSRSTAGRRTGSGPGTFAKRGRGGVPLRGAGAAAPVATSGEVPAGPVEPGSAPAASDHVVRLRAIAKTAAHCGRRTVHARTAGKPAGCVRAVPGGLRWRFAPFRRSNVHPAYYDTCAGGIVPRPGVFARIRPFSRLHGRCPRNPTRPRPAPSGRCFAASGAPAKHEDGRGPVSGGASPGGPARADPRSGPTVSRLYGDADAPVLRPGPMSWSPRTADRPISCVRVSGNGD